MHKTKLRLLTVQWLWLAVISCAVHAAALEHGGRPEDVGLSTERLERLTAALQQYVDDDKLAGSVTLIARRGKIAYLEAVGERDREARAPMRTDSIFRIASQIESHRERRCAAPRRGRQAAADGSGRQVFAGVSRD